VTAFLFGSAQTDQEAVEKLRIRREKKKAGSISRSSRSEHLRRIRVQLPRLYWRSTVDTILEFFFALIGLGQVFCAFEMRLISLHQNLPDLT